ncbi:acyl-CoA dehydrogenase family protein [Pseudosulfitobacter pseudonitzschiae]|uniref:acyl-CoA dehydrogenase family protein n=1 Tax=Pseudosulfitobacter pseudonitzschiae TaxID=1402135 RepID=UPI001AF91328|nr:acyl-CoA dehydrogenase family protein [Pseudosulfitobacter pseudonitzschiae]MBM1817535.1 acyl-CoA dehydrogenase family protein [Pseudosulfitobacter pseudonitzschiae]MBM1834374.1 acyl-CoA dehydrogenase family protein [Pseudosulfitobacter pseudonitzschiae]MBM1839311.1 acyl-CoA dehydrogenase family protein [Pseudosulfitobacter pseudonitzschiae]MBM1844089.1 acyl-CoA dehydrogenase family protein [Pseudosulfitobacter pseudonitzschiae]MBM1848996.1 acyl-CoA dehydrogenase family protein [Pseudosulfi
MIYGLTDEQTMIADTVRSFVEHEIYPHEELVERTGEVPAEIAQEIKQKTRDLGFYACNFPENVGCAGLNHVEFALVERELGRGSMALNHFFGRPQNILMACEGEQIDRYLMPAVRGERMDALAMTEPGAGSDVRGMKCNAVRDGGDWVVNGTKHFISGADHADFVIVFIATGEDQTPKGPKKRITAFLVDRGTAGFTIRDGYKSVSHRGYKNMILEFDDCRLPDAQVLGEVHGGFEVMNTWLYATRITVATMSVGRARRVFDYALNYAAEREQFGQKIGKFQGVSFQIADMITQIDAADLLTLASADRLDKGLPANREIASAKLYASEMLGRVTDAAIQIHGGMGLMDDYPLERFWRDARVERIWDGTSEIQRHIISRELLRALGA